MTVRKSFSFLVLVFLVHSSVTKGFENAHPIGFFPFERNWENLESLDLSEEVVTSSGHPRERKDWPRIGILAQRKRNRPNRLGVSIEVQERRDFEGAPSFIKSIQIPLTERERSMVKVLSLDAVHPSQDLQAWFEIDQVRISLKDILDGGS